MEAYYEWKLMWTHQTEQDGETPGFRGRQTCLMTLQNNKCLHREDKGLWDLESCISCYGNGLLPRAFQNSSTVKNTGLPYFSNGKHRVTERTHDCKLRY